MAVSEPDPMAVAWMPIAMGEAPAPLVTCAVALVPIAIEALLMPPTLFAVAPPPIATAPEAPLAMVPDPAPDPIATDGPVAVPPPAAYWAEADPAARTPIDASRAATPPAPRPPSPRRLRSMPRTLCARRRTASNRRRVARVTGPQPTNQFDANWLERPCAAMAALRSSAELFMSSKSRYQCSNRYSKTQLRHS